MTFSDLYAELGTIIAGKKPGRESDDEIIIFDSTGTALQDVASATIIYEKAMASGAGKILDFSDSKERNEKNIDTLKSWFPFR
jgi:ornithine cyclodeaminase/alanine dehydrogenase-like protein (mu-crystallin family)